MSELDMKVAGPVPSQNQWSNFDHDSLSEAIQYFDDSTGEVLPSDLVEKGKQEELGWAKSINLYDKVPRSVAIGRGIKPIPVRWVYVNKGDKNNYNVRCRLVSKELNSKTKESLLAHEVFSATPPWEIVKLLFSLLVCDGPHNSHDEMEIGVYDISRAHFMAEALRELYIELPDIDQTEGADEVGRLNRSMYGCRDASHSWMLDWQALLSSAGCSTGKANPSLFYNKELNARGAVHGDDFIVCGPRRALDKMNEFLQSKYSVRESHRLGFNDRCTKSACILNRVISLSFDERGKKQVCVEPDFRHVELLGGLSHLISG